MRRILVTGSHVGERTRDLCYLSKHLFEWVTSNRGNPQAEGARRKEEGETSRNRAEGKRARVRGKEGGEEVRSEKWERNPGDRELKNAPYELRGHVQGFSRSAIIIIAATFIFTPRCWICTILHHLTL